MRYITRRNLLGQSIVLLAAGFTACHTAPVANSSTKEVVSSVLISADGKHLVVLTPRYHYIFETTSTILKALKSNFHPYVNAGFSPFRVTSRGRVSGTVTLDVPKMPSDVYEAAVAAGFEKSLDGAMVMITLHGERYAANDVQIGAQYALNRTYQIEVVGDGIASGSSPIGVVEGTLLLGVVVLFFAFHPHWPG